MVVTIYTCECGSGVSVEASNRNSYPESVECPKCRGWIKNPRLSRGRSAAAGEVVSDNLGCGIGQEEQGNRDLADAGIDAHYRKGDGALVAASSRAYDEAAACRGMHNNASSGTSSRKMHRIRDNSMRGNPRKS